MNTEFPAIDAIHEPDQRHEALPADRVRACITAPETAPTAAHAAVWLEEDGGVWADYPTVPPDDHVLPLAWAEGRPVSRGELGARGYVLSRIAVCRTELVSTFGMPQVDRSAQYACVWLDDEGDVWADYPTADLEADLVLPLVWAREQTNFRSELAERGYAFTRIGWSL
ncbi:hypothetical protein GCM10017744_104900 [Streptomyces antimycoticus]|uniref:hypothetical protein n=1 Tax=Streptomyces antimycoticus TaxID=68175 RepID=UPI0031E56D83